MNDPEPLTPSKLLYGFSVTTLPHPVVDPQELEDEDFNEQDQFNNDLKWCSLQLFQHFVQQFKSEYFASLWEHHVYQSKKRESQEEIIKVWGCYTYACLKCLLKFLEVLCGSDGLKLLTVQYSSCNPWRSHWQILRNTLQELNCRFHRSKHSEEANKLLQSLAPSMWNLVTSNLDSLQYC